MKSKIAGLLSASAIALSSVLFWTGCDSSTNPTGTPSGNTHAALINSCTLVTQAEAEAILGQPVLTVKLDTNKYITNCEYLGSVASGFILPSRLSVTAFTTAGIQGGLAPTFTVPIYFAGLKTNTTDWEAVGGVGTEAIWQKKPGTLQMYKGDVTAALNYSPHGTAIDTSAAAKAGAIAAGIKVAEKL